jgi:hypothetical protein
MRTQINNPIWKRDVGKRDTELGSKQKYILRWAKKIKAIEYKGGKCYKCGDTRVYTLVFHHRDSELKENSIERMITVQKRWGEIQIELDKYDLVCENCHREIHAKNAKINNRKERNKRVCFEFKNSFSCNGCGYSKCNWALEFHHNNDKVIGISKYFTKHSWETVNDLQEWVIDELEKCEVYCSNCHKEKHFNSEHFNKFRKEIYEKSKNIKEKNPSVNKEQALCLLQNGKTVKEVATELNCSYFRAYEISKEYGIRDNIHRVNKKLILQLWNNGKTRKQIMLETGYGKSSVLKIVKEILNESKIKNLSMSSKSNTGESAKKS